MLAVGELAGRVHVDESCEILGISPATYHRFRARFEQESAQLGHPPGLEPPPQPPKPRAPRFNPRALTPEEREAVWAVLTEERFVDKTPRAIWATLLEEGVYLCHWRTMYRLLHELGPVVDRRPQRRHPQRPAPALTATGPNQVWSWDITYLSLGRRGCFAYLYTVLDIYSRCVVGWTVAEVESGEVAVQLVRTTCERHGIEAEQLVLHADRGGPMRSRPLSELLEELGVTPSHSRPRVSNDNAFIKAHFKTLKYSAGFPGAFSSLEEARDWVRGFVETYNQEHRHSGLGLLTPAQVHSGGVAEVQDRRLQVLHAAAQQHPLRFHHQQPKLPKLPQEVSLGQPRSLKDSQDKASEASKAD